MKQLLTIFIVAAMINSCSNPASDSVKDFIPGVYVKTIDDEFTKGMDTLAIEVLDKTAGSYSVKKRMSYQQTIDKRELSPQYKEEKWTAIYDETTHQLMEQRKGKVLSFSPDQGLLSLGGSEYRKIK